MNLKIFLVAGLALSVISSQAFNIDSSLTLAFALGHSSPQQSPDPEYGPAEGDMYAAVNLSASASWNTSWPLNYAGLSHAREIQFTMDKFINGGPDQHPFDYKNSIYVGHQFRNDPYRSPSPIYVPLTIGASGSTGIYRGNYVSDNQPNGSNNPYGPSEVYYEEKKFYAVGGFIEFDPSIIIQKTSSFGLHFLVDFNTHRTDFVWGIQAAILIP